MADGGAPVVLPTVGPSTYTEVFRMSAQVFRAYAGTPLTHFRLPDFQHTRQTILQANPAFWFDVCSCLLGALLLTFLRLSLDRLFVHSINRKLSLVKPAHLPNFLDSLYVCLASTIAFFTAYIIVHHQYDLLPLNTTFWSTYTINQTVPPSIWFLYIFNFSHYLHCLFAVLRLNPWTGLDSRILLIHHCIVLLLLTFSHLLKFHYFGVVMLYLHGICDVILEATKMILKLQLGSGWAQRFVGIYKLAGFPLLLFFWFYFLLVVYPLKVIYEGVLYFAQNGVEEVPVMFLLLILLWCIFALSFYWAFLLLRILYKNIFKIIIGITDILVPTWKTDDGETNEKKFN